MESDDEPLTLKSAKTELALASTRARKHKVNVKPIRQTGCGTAVRQMYPEYQQR